MICYGYPYILINLINFLGDQIYLSNVNPNVTQRGQETIDNGRQVIVPNATFNCNGTITNVAASMKG